MEQPFIIETQGLTKEFKGFRAVNGVDLRIRRGSIHALIGPNGAGRGKDNDHARNHGASARGADLLLLDEPTEGLAPVIVQQIGAIIRDLKTRGFTLLLVEQNFHFASTVADRHYVVEHGSVVDEVENGQLAANKSKLEAYLGI